MIRSDGNQFGRHYLWLWFNRNVDTDSVFENVKYLRKYFNTKTSFLNVKYKNFEKSI